MASVMALALLMAVAAAEAGSYDSMVLRTLNEMRDSKINPAIQQALVDPLHVKVSETLKTPKECILKSPFGRGCLCKGKAVLTVQVDDVQGMKQLTIRNFTSAHVDGVTFTAWADVDDLKLRIPNGVSGAELKACGETWTADGAVTSNANVSSIRIAVTALGTWTGKCIKLDATNASLDEADLQLSETDINIEKDGLPPSVNLDSFKDLLKRAADKIASSLKIPVQNAIVRAMKKAQPCVPLTGKVAVAV